VNSFNKGQLIHDHDFKLFQSLFYTKFGLHLSEQKKLLLSGRLGKRICDLGLDGYRAYYDLIIRNPDEFQVAINKITTNETYFFREPHQFDYLRDHLIPILRDRDLRVWSAACSSGEEPYSIAMMLYHCLGNAGWNILATDINTKVLESARVGMYSMERISGIPDEYLKKFCLKGVGDYDGKLLVDASVREKVSFLQMNLTQLTSKVGMFQIVFLRNAIIYFDHATKERVLQSVCDHLVSGGWLFLGHSESVMGMNLPVRQVIPSIFQKV